MKRVAILSSTYAPSMWSGLGRHTYFLAKALSRKGYAVSVYTFTASGSTFREKDGISTITYIGGIVSSSVKALPHNAIDAWNGKILSLLNSEHFDYIILPTCHGWKAAKEYGKAKIITFAPFLYHFTGWSSPTPEADQKAMLASELDCLQHSAVIVCHNEHFAKSVATFINREIFILPTCHYESEDHGIQPAQEKNTVCYVGRINKEKSLETVIRAMVDAQEITLNITYPENSAYYIPKLQRLAKSLDVEHRVNFLGWIPSNEVRKLYAKSEIAVVPSQHESYGYPVLDPMSFGSIPLVSYWSGLRDYVDENISVFTSIDLLRDKFSAIRTMSPIDKAAYRLSNKSKLESQYSETSITNLLDEIVSCD